MILEHHGTLAQSQIVVTIVHFLTSYYLNTTKVIYQVRFLDINDVKTCHWHLSKSTFQFFGPHFEYIPTYDFDVLQGTLVPMYLPDVLKRVEKWKCFFKRFTYMNWVPVLRICSASDDVYRPPSVLVSLLLLPAADLLLLLSTCSKWTMG